jgi:hypothetical protein
MIPLDTVGAPVIIWRSSPPASVPGGGRRCATLAEAEVHVSRIKAGKSAYGGVSPRRAVRAAAPPAAAGGGAHPDFKYNGGAVIQSPQVYSSFWGPLWSDADHAARADRLNQFLQDLLNSTYMNVLSQYGVGAGAGAAGSFISSSSVPNVPSQLDESGIGQVIQGLIDSGQVPEPPATGNNIALVIYLDETVAVDQPGLQMCEPADDNAFGFHFDFVTNAGNEFYYAVIPALDDACLQNTCPNPATCSLQLSLTQEQRLTQVTSHEFAEMCTDPKFPTGWFGPTSDENGDICNGESASITVGNNTWNVQRQYSKTDDENTNGTAFCLVDAPSPMPERPDGPA